MWVNNREEYRLAMIITTKELYHGVAIAFATIWASSSGDQLVELPKMQQGNSNYVLYTT